MNQHHIVHVPAITRHLQFPLHEMVQRVQIDVGKKLTRQIAYGQTLAFPAVLQRLVLGQAVPRIRRTAYKCGLQRVSKNNQVHEKPAQVRVGYSRPPTTVQSRRFVKGKQEQSKRYLKAKSKVARLHEKVANQRRDWLHKVSRDLADRYQYVFVEDVNLNKMASELEHGKTVGDQGFGLLRQYLAYKTNLVKVPANNTSKMCHHCGNVNPEVVLGVKRWVCPVCSTQHDRDVNAAQNILYLGVKRTLGREPTEVLNNARLQNRECPKPSAELSAVS